MIVYRAPRSTLAIGPAFAELEANLGRLLAADPISHDAWVEPLIDAGQIEAGVADAVCPEADGVGGALEAVQDVTLCCARGERAAWRGEAPATMRVLARLALAAVRRAREHPMPAACDVGVPEGYAYYALYPESYGEAARRFAHGARPTRVTCVGIRTIGTSLSAVVAAELESRGCEVERWTVRPRGHPFDRRLRLDSRLAERIAARRDGHALIVDEGPGLSGSSFVATADALASLGFPSDRIVVFPSWDADGTTFNNEHARQRWRELPRYVVDFDDVWIANGRLARLAGGPFSDLSAGRWREVLIPDRRQWPAVQPQHEQRKYLVAPSTQQQAAWLKFVGLGRYGRARLERAERLGHWGHVPRPLSLEGGFLRSALVPGTPLRAGGLEARLVGQAAVYLARVRQEFRTGRSPSFDALVEMVELNAREGLGTEAGSTTALREWRDVVEQSEVIAIDGRTLAHEWIRRDDATVVKTDALSHHDDHFWPGCQDIAWDVAAATFELRLGVRAARSFVDCYRRASGDADIATRLPFWRVAYLASRLGYTSMAAGALGAAPDGRRMRRLARRYAGALRRSLGELRRPARARVSGS